MEKVQVELERLRQSLLPSLEPLQITLNAKTPYKAVHFREALLWRTVELASSACELLKSGRIAAGITLVRGVAESAAAMRYLSETVQSFCQCENRSLQEVDEKLMRLLMGDRRNSDMPDAINVLTMLKHANRTVPGVSDSYEILSEFAHPNWSGTCLLFSKIDSENHVVSFGVGQRSENSAKIAISSLHAALKIVSHAYDEIADFYPSFVEACESELAPTNK